MQLNKARRNALIAGLIFVAILIGIAITSWFSEQRAQQRQAIYVIPPGTAARLNAGEKTDVLPGTIKLSLARQDTLIIQNEDSEAASIGGLRILPGQQYRQKFYQPGSFKLNCSTHTSGELVIVIEP